MIIKEKFDEIGVCVHNSDFPDVDIDYSDRDKAKDYLVSKYGNECVCSVGTIGRLKTKGVLQDLARIHNVSLDEVLKVTKGELNEIEPDELESHSLDELCSMFPSLDELLKKYPEFKKDFERLRGSINFWGKHAGGVILSNTPLTDVMPVRVIDGKLVSCWTEGLSGRELGEMGFIKMDLLGVKAMSVFYDIAELVKNRYGKEYTYENTPLGDSRALQALNNHDNLAVYQFDSELSNRVVDQMGGVESFDDLVALTALIRPSALQNKFPKKFNEFKNDPQKQKEIPKIIRDILGETAGLPLFQESAFLISRNLAGFDKVDAYKFMKKLYKNQFKKQEEIEQWREKFLKGCEDKFYQDCVEVQFEDGNKKIFKKNEKVFDVNGNEYTIEEAIEKNIDLKL